MIKRFVDYLYNLIKSVEESIYGKVHFIPSIERSIQFDSYSCAVHAVYTIFRHFNFKTGYKEIMKRLETTVDGTDTPQIVRLFIDEGFKVHINTNATIEDIYDAVKKGQPAIITINEWEHWIVVYGFSSNRVFVIDSNHKRLFSSIKYGKFKQIWDDNWIALISPK